MLNYLQFQKQMSVWLEFWAINERIARVLGYPMNDIHTIYSISRPWNDEPIFSRMAVTAGTAPADDLIQPGFRQGG